MNRKIPSSIAFLIIFISVAVLAGTIYIYEESYQVPELIVKTDESAVEEITAKTLKISQTSDDPSYTIDFEYLEFSGIQNPEMNKKINNDVKNKAEAIIDSAKPDFDSVACKRTGGCTLINKATFSCVADLISLNFEYYAFMGGAHGLTTSATYNYKISNGSQISLSDIFKKDSGYLKIISDYCIGDLKKQLIAGEENMSDESWIQTGAAPNEENYKDNAIFSKDGMTVVFQQYQVAAGAVGILKVSIPYEKLKDIIDPDGPLGVFSQK
jgi:hypothetical protein